MISISVIEYHDTLVISAVCALPQTPIQDVISALQQVVHTYSINSGFIIAGDLYYVKFNVEEPRTTQFLAFFSRTNLSSASPTVTSTTATNTEIDDIFTSLSPSSHKSLYSRIA